jgi:glycosyltransferase involved in cell wall biosynthesis
MKRFLFVAFHFPPMSGSSGQLRALKFCRYLPQNGWEPIVLTARPCAYPQLDPGSTVLVPGHLRIIRSFALDAQRHLSLWGRYPRAFALPDRWLSWCLFAVPSGLLAIYRHKIEAIVTTFPTATAVLIGLLLHRVSGKPWIVDFRDSMTEDEYPADPLTRRVYRWIEKLAIRYAAKLIFTAQSTITMYLRRYPELQAEKCVLIPNGYDEEDFRGLSASAPALTEAKHRVHLAHMGVLYPKERDPRPFYRALASLKQSQLVCAEMLRVDLRGAGSEEFHWDEIRRLGIEDIVQVLPPIPYAQALAEAARADGLLIFQAASCNHQIPAKVYEYMRLGKPILALTDAGGDTAALLRQCGGATIVNLADEHAIAAALPEFLESLRMRTHTLPDASQVGLYSRESQARDLARCLSATTCPGSYRKNGNRRAEVEKESVLLR